ncbi:MAG TPA: phosphoribosylglycinamide formyltransferase [Verrucomicrobiae bacterium]|nr:phosphoribosylglycinamide formyltransferase [Verrucomicrobiae bacterium]
MTGTDFRIGVLGSGTGSNCEAILEACATGRIPGRVALVLSDVADAVILERARKRGVEAEFIGPSRFKTKLEPELEQRAVTMLREAGVDLVALAGYMRVVKSPMLRAFAGRVVNVHPSLLPAFPGLHAWEQALHHGVKVTGCTVHFVDDGVDSGPIILQQAVPVLANDTPPSLHQRIQLAEHEIYPQAIRLFAEGKLEINGRVVRIVE